MTLHSWFGSGQAFTAGVLFSPQNLRRKRRRKFSLFAAEVLEVRALLSGTPAAVLQLLPATGQASPPPVTLALDSFHFGVGVGEGLPTFDDLEATTRYNANAPQLFASLTRGRSYARAVLTQDD